MHGKCSLLLLLASCEQPPIESTPTGKDAAFVQAFVSACVRDFNNRDRVEAVAKAMSWKPIVDPNMRKMLGPENGAGNWRGWALQHEGGKFMLALTDTSIEQKQVRNCVLVGEVDSLAATKSRIGALLAANKRQEETEGGQTTEIWQFKGERASLLLSFIDAEPMGMKMLNAGVSTDWINAK